MQNHVGRGLPPSRLLTGLSQEIQILHASVSFPMVHLKNFE